MPPAYVKPYVKRGKNDEVDAEPICEAVTRPTMRFVPIKSAEQQSILMLHRTRDLFVRQRTMLVNSLRGQLAEFGLIAPQGIWRIPEPGAGSGYVLKPAPMVVEGPNVACRCRCRR
jgi:transposase